MIAQIGYLLYISLMLSYLSHYKTYFLHLFHRSKPLLLPKNSEQKLRLKLQGIVVIVVVVVVVVVVVHVVVVICHR